MRNALIIGGVAVVAYFILTRKASAMAPASGGGSPGRFGSPGFVQQGSPSAPVAVIGCSFVRAGGILLDATTGKEISEAEAQRRAQAEGCIVPPKPGQNPSNPSIFVGGK